MAKIGLLLFLLLAVTVLRAEEGVPFPLTVPEALFVSVGAGQHGHSYTAVFDGKGLAYFQVGGKAAEKVIIHPKPEAWRKFMGRMNDLKVYRWAADYGLPKSAVSQGTQWILLLRSGGQTVKSKGGGSFPAEDASFSQHIFDQFCHAVSDLTGKPFPARVPIVPPGA